MDYSQPSSQPSTPGRHRTNSNPVIPPTHQPTLTRTPTSDNRKSQYLLVSIREEDEEYNIFTSENAPAVPAIPAQYALAPSDVSPLGYNPTLLPMRSKSSASIPEDFYSQQAYPSLPPGPFQTAGLTHSATTGRLPHTFLTGSPVRPVYQQRLWETSPSIRTVPSPHGDQRHSWAIGSTQWYSPGSTVALNTSHSPGPFQGFSVTPSGSPGPAQSLSFDPRYSPGPTQGLGFGPSQSPGPAMSFGVSLAPPCSPGPGYGFPGCFSPGLAPTPSPGAFPLPPSMPRPPTTPVHSITPHPRRRSMLDTSPGLDYFSAALEHLALVRQENIKAREGTRPPPPGASALSHDQRDKVEMRDLVECLGISDLTRPRIHPATSVTRQCANNLVPRATSRKPLPRQRSKAKSKGRLRRPMLEVQENQWPISPIFVNWAQPNDEPKPGHRLSFHSGKLSKPQTSEDANAGKGRFKFLSFSIRSLLPGHKPPVESHKVSQLDPLPVRYKRIEPPGFRDEDLFADISGVISNEEPIHSDLTQMDLEYATFEQLTAEPWWQREDREMEERQKLNAARTGWKREKAREEKQARRDQMVLIGKEWRARMKSRLVWGVKRFFR